jgi:predicted nucleotidyltransferase
MLHPIFVSVVGSRLYDIAHEDSDYDIKGVAFGEVDQYCGLKVLKQDDYSNGKTGKDYYNGTIYEIRRCFELLEVGNPTMIEPFFASSKYVIHSTAIGEKVAKFVRENMISKHFFKPYFGYHYSQIKEFEHSQREGKRKELFDKYGFDGKFAGHAYRLSKQCVGLMTTGILDPTLRDQDKEIVMNMRNYKYSKQECLVHLQQNIVDMETALANSKLPDTIDREQVNKFVTETVCTWVTSKLNGTSQILLPQEFDIKSFPK